MDLTTLTVDFFEKVQLAVFAGLMSVMEPQAPVGLEMMQKELDAVRKQSEANVEQMMKVSLAYAIRISRRRKWISTLPSCRRRKRKSST